MTSWHGTPLVFHFLVQCRSVPASMAVWLTGNENVKPTTAPSGTCTTQTSEYAHSMRWSINNEQRHKPAPPRVGPQASQTNSPPWPPHPACTEATAPRRTRQAVVSTWKASEVGRTRNRTNPCPNARWSSPHAHCTHTHTHLGWDNSLVLGGLSHASFTEQLVPHNPTVGAAQVHGPHFALFAAVWELRDESVHNVEHPGHAAAPQAAHSSKPQHARWDHLDGAANVVQAAAHFVDEGVAQVTQ